MKTGIEQNEVLRMARDAGLLNSWDEVETEVSIQELERFAAIVREDERGAIMEICNRHLDPIAGVIHHAIRARNNE